MNVAVAVAVDKVVETVGVAVSVGVFGEVDVWVFAARFLVATSVSADDVLADIALIDVHEVFFVAIYYYGGICVRSVLVRLLFDNGRLIMARLLVVPRRIVMSGWLVSFVVRHRQTTNAFSKRKHARHGRTCPVTWWILCSILGFP